MSFNTAHLIETALLLLAAYVLGCVLGYGIRRILYAARGTRQVTALAVPEKSACRARPRGWPQGWTSLCNPCPGRAKHCRQTLSC